MPDGSVTISKDKAPGGLTPKQESFVLAYLETGNATEAAASSGIDLDIRTPEDKAYVYFLLCPRMERIIYVGKGRKRRMHHHLRDVRAGRVSGRKKDAALREFTRAGMTPISAVFCRSMTDEQALALEKALVFAIGPHRLSNTLSCTGNKWQRALDHYNGMMARVKPFCMWLEHRKPHPTEFGIYAWWVSTARHNGKEIARRV